MERSDRSYAIVTSNVSYDPSVFFPLREVFIEIPVKREWLDRKVTFVVEHLH